MAVKRLFEVFTRAKIDIFTQKVQNAGKGSIWGTLYDIILYCIILILNSAKFDLNFDEF